MHLHRTIVTLFLIALSWQYAYGETLVEDSFESQDMSALGNENFSWGRNNRTSVVTMDPEPLAVYNNKTIANPGDPTTDWSAFDGEHALRFRYAAGEYMAEQRFSLSSEHTQIWVSFWLRVPENFYHPTSNQGNQKLFAMWMDGYEIHGDGPTSVFQFRRSSENPGGSTFTNYHYSPRVVKEQRHSGERSGNELFIEVPRDQGRWMQLVFHLVASSSLTSSDGIIEVWRRWQDQTTYSKIYDYRQAYLGMPEGINGFRAGYLMGWANAPYTETTEFLIDDFKIATTSLLDDEINPPEPPKELQVQ